MVVKIKLTEQSTLINFHCTKLEVENRSKAVGSNTKIYVCPEAKFSMDWGTIPSECSPLSTDLQSINNPLIRQKMEQGLWKRCPNPQCRILSELESGCNFVEEKEQHGETSEVHNRIDCKLNVMDVLEYNSKSDLRL